MLLWITVLILLEQPERTAWYSAWTSSRVTYQVTRFRSARCKSDILKPPKSHLALGDGKEALASNSFRDRQVSEVSHFYVYGFTLRIAVCSRGIDRWQVARGLRKALDPWPAIRFREVVRSHNPPMSFLDSATPRPKTDPSPRKKDEKLSYVRRKKPSSTPPPLLPTTRLAPATWLDWRPQLNSKLAVYRYWFRVLRGVNYVTFAQPERQFFFSINRLGPLRVVIFSTFLNVSDLREIVSRKSQWSKSSCW